MTKAAVVVVCVGEEEIDGSKHMGVIIKRGGGEVLFPTTRARRRNYDHFRNSTKL
jgi:hypothetical protein